MLTPSQLIVLKTDIVADGSLNANPNGQDGNEIIAAAYNANAAPAFTVWKSTVPIGDIGRKFDGGELGGLTTANHTRLQTIAHFLIDGVTPAIASNRAFFDDVFSGAGGVITRAALLALWKRPARRIEKLFATGTGSDPSPATLVFEGTISHQDVNSARNLP